MLAWQQYYLHNQFIANGLRKNVKEVKIDNRHLVCMSNDYVLELYQYTSNGIRYQAKHSINCSIAKLQILPTKQTHKDDYIFIIDKKGRFGVWRNEIGFQFVQNQEIQSERSLYKSDDDLDEVLFSGEVHHFDVFDTKGSVFFSIKHTIVVVDYTITRIGFSIIKTTKFSIPYVQYRFINWVKSSKKGKFLGIIQQVEERTLLKVHNLQGNVQLNSQNIVYQHQKINLNDFVSENNELVIVSDDEITGISLTKAYNHLYTHKAHSVNGRVVCLNAQTFCYIGQELLAFSKTKIKSYGTFTQNQENIFQKKGVFEVSFLKETQNNGYLVCISTLNNELYFLTLFENSWELYYHLKALTSIYSIHPTSNNHSVVAVMDQSYDEYQIVVVEKQGLMPLVKEQECGANIDRLISIDEGRYIVVGSPESNSLMRFNEQSVEFDSVCELPKGNILLISNHIMITVSALYAISLDGSYCEELAKQEIILSACNNERIIYMNSEGSIKMITTEPLGISVLRDNAFDEYCWYLLKNNSLVVAKTANAFSLFLYQLDNSVSEIGLTENCLISSIHHFTHEDSSKADLIVVGYMNGSIYLYSLEGDFKACLAGNCHEPVAFFSITPGLLGVTSGSKQFVLSSKHNKYTIKPIEFSRSDNNIVSVAYLEIAGKFIFIENSQRESNKLIRMVSLADVYEGFRSTTNNHDSYRIKTIRDCLPEIPTVFLFGQYILVGMNSNLHVYQLQSGRLVRTLTHYLKDVIGIIELECGLVMYGIDSIERNLIYVYSRDIEEVCFINFILKDNKYIKTLREIPHTNKFLCRGETFTSLCELNFPKEISELFEFKIDLQGYSLQIEHQHSFLGETDSKRLLVVFSYSGSLLPIARFVGPSEINDFLMMYRCVVIGDKSGYIHVLEFNTEDSNQTLRMTMTKVASINVGEEVTTLSKRSSTQALYGTISGRIGSIQIINEEGFTALKPAQEERFKELSRGKDFEYVGWRGRNMTEDKLIDGALVKQYIHKKSKQMLTEDERVNIEEAHRLLEKLNI